MIAKAIINPDNEIQVVKQDTKDTNIPNNILSTPICCKKCSTVYNLPLGCKTFRCRSCSEFNSTEINTPVVLCNIL